MMPPRPPAGLAPGQPDRPARRDLRRRRHAPTPRLERLEDRRLMSGIAPFGAGAVDLPAGPAAHRSEGLARPDADQLYRLTLDRDGLLVASVHASGPDTALSLLDDQGRALIQSLATSPTDPDDRIAQHLSAGTYYLGVAGRAGSGVYELDTAFTPASPPRVALSEGTGSVSVTAADLNGDRAPDIITTDSFNDQVLINFGAGDGTSRPPVTVPVPPGSGPSFVLAADLDGDGVVDLAVADRRSNSVSILIGQGGGTFRPAVGVATGAGPTWLASGDFDGDGRPDLAVAAQDDDSVDVLKGLGGGRFAGTGSIEGMGAPDGIAVADFDGDGHADLAVSRQSGNDLIVLRGLGDGNFAPGPRLTVGRWSRSVTAADFDRDGRPDLAAIGPLDGAVLVFRNLGGSFAAPARLSAGELPSALVAADLDGDGDLDLAACNFGSNDVSLFAGLGDGGFGPATSQPTGSGPSALAAADLDGDGRPDLVTSDRIGLTVSVLMNNGNATFLGPPRRAALQGPEDVTAADLDGDGVPDLVVPDLATNQVSVLIGRGDGSFRDPIESPAGMGPFQVVVGDFDGDRVPDLGVVDYLAFTVSILLGQGDGHFRAGQSLVRGGGFGYIRSADLDRDGRLDLAVANYLTNDVSLFYGRGDGTFDTGATLQVGSLPSGLVVGDFDRDGRPDLAVSCAGTGDVEILRGAGGRAFGRPASFPAGAQPASVVSADLDGDGRADLVVAGYASSDVGVLLGAGDGTFGAPVRYPADPYTYRLAVGDFNDDGRPDVIAGALGSGDLSLLLGRGDGTLGVRLIVHGGAVPYGIAVADYNGDGHPDLATANNQSNDLLINLGRGGGAFDGPQPAPLSAARLPTIVAYLHGNGVPYAIVADTDEGTLSVSRSQGDGTFRAAQTVRVGGRPSALGAGDFNGDGRIDLAVADAQYGEVLILLGLGDGTFRDPIRYRVGLSPHSVVAGDFDRDGVLDLAVANTDSDDVSVLLGRGDGTFGAGRRYPVGKEPVSLGTPRDVNGDGWLDLATVNRTSHDLSLLYGGPGGLFLPQFEVYVGEGVSAVASGDFDGDGRLDVASEDPKTGRVGLVTNIQTGRGRPPIFLEVGTGPALMLATDLVCDARTDLLVANVDAGNITIFGGWANGSFAGRATIPVAGRIAGVAVADLNNDGHPDLIVTNGLTGGFEAYLWGGDGVYSSPESNVPLPHPAPIVFPHPVAGLSDIVNIDTRGQILLRLGRAGARGEFNAPISETAGTGIVVRDFALVATGGLPVVALLDARRPFVYIQRTDITGPGGLTVVPLPGVGNYTRVVAGDLFGEGRDDLIVIDRVLNRILIYRQDPGGHFAPRGDPIPVGFGPTDVTLARLDGDVYPALVVANGSSGDISVIRRGPGGGFGPECRLPGGLSPAGTALDSDGDELRRTSPDLPVGVVAGVFDASGLADVVVVDRGTDRISVLKGIPGGGLANPGRSTTYSTGLDPIQAVAARLGVDGRLDLAVLNEGSHDVSIFMNDGRGGFITMARVDAGDDPTGLAVSDVTGDGIADLVVSNDNGDVLILTGRGDGTFQPYQRADRTVNLAVGDLTGSGQTDFVLSNASKDLLTVQPTSTTPGFIQGRGDGLLAPGPVAIADMNRDGIPDLIVINTGGNDVFIYLGLGQGRFGPPQRFFTGTAPVGLTVADLTGDGLLDLVVANSGSNDVTILLGRDGANPAWTMTPGPRLRAGDRPVSTTVADLVGDGKADIVVVNQDGNSVSVLRGLGGGFFDDEHPQTLRTGLTPVQAFVGHFTSVANLGLLVLNAASNDMTYYPNLLAQAITVSTGGLNPVAGVQGDFNRDGYADLAVANNADSRITLFDGGYLALTLAESVLVGGSAHPTDLVVSGGAGGGLRFFVGAEGQDRAIPIYFSTIVSTMPTGSASGSGGLAVAGGGFRTSAGLNAVGGLDPIFVGQFSALARQLTLGSSQSGIQALGAGGEGGQGSLVTILSGAGQSLFYPTLRSLNWLIDNLMRIGQDQTADILPIGQDEIAAVAVLLAASSLSASVEDPAAPVEPGGAGEDATPWVPARDEPDSPPPTPVVRFLSEPGSSIAGLAFEAIAAGDRGDDFGSEWVWLRRQAGASATALAFTDGRADDPAAPSPGPDAEVERALGAGAVSGALWLDETPGAGSIAGPATRLILAGLAAVAAAATGLLAWRGPGRKLLGARGGKGRAARPEPGVTPRPEAVGSRYASNRSRKPHELPPWLQGPKPAGLRRTDPGRKLAPTLFRRRGRVRSD